MLASRLPLVAFMALPLAAACFSTEPLPLGVVEFETQGDVSVEEGIDEAFFVESSQWSIRFDRFLVHVGAGALGESSASAVPLGGAPYVLVDQVLPGPKVIVTARDVVAKRWGGLAFTINPVRATSTLAGGATEDDRRSMQQKGASIRVKGTATRGETTKTFDWSFLQVIAFADCSIGVADGSTQLGISVRPAATNDVPIVFSALPLFDPVRKSSLPPRGRLRFDAFADADVDSDGKITEPELRRVNLGELRADTTANLEANSYAAQPPDDPPFTTLWEFLSAQVAETVRIGVRGRCQSMRYQ
jgi:hypothetical protein